MRAIIDRIRSADLRPGRFVVSGVFIVVLVAASGASAGQIPARPVAPARPVSPPAPIAGLAEQPYAPLAFSRAWLAKVADVRSRRSELRAEGRLDGMNPVEAAAEGAALTGTLRVPVLAVRYADVAQPFPNTVLAERLFGQGTADTVSYSSYWSEVSNGLLEVTGVVTPWLTLPHRARHYLPAEQHGWARFGRIMEVIEHALASADQYLDFGEFDNDGPDGVPNSGDDDGFVDFVAIVFALPCGDRSREGSIWPHRAAMPPIETRSRSANGGFIRISDYVILPAIDPVTCTPMHVGVLAHETGHALGLPDLYAYDGVWPGIGDWGLMGTGSHGEVHSPAHPSAWEKEQLGWVRVDWIDDDTAALTLPPVTREPVVYRYDVPDGGGRYLLLENRQKLGSDQRLPGQGMLVWRIDPERGELGAWNNDERRPAVELIEAGDRGEFGHVLRGHPGDPFPGKTQRTEYHEPGEPRFRLSSILETDGVITAQIRTNEAIPSLLPRQGVVRMTALAGGVAARHAVAIERHGGASFGFELRTGETWLEARSAGDLVVLRARPDELPPGTYMDTVRLVDGVGATAAQILVSFYVAAPGIGQIVATELPWSWGLAARDGQILQASFGWDPLGLRPRPRVLELWEGATHPATLSRIPSDALYSPAIDATGDAWVLAWADGENHLYRLTPGAGAEIVASGFGSGPAYGVAALPDGGVLVAAWDGRMYRIDRDGSVALRYTVNARLYQIATDAEGTVFAALYSGDILRIAPDGLSSVIPTGYGEGRLVAVAATPDGSVFAAERGGQGRIERIDAAGHREVVFQRSGAQFYGVTVDGAFLYALDLATRELLRIPLPEAGILANQPEP